MILNYSINGITFASMGLLVQASKGLLQGLKLKEPVSYNWPDSHGEEVDLSRPRYLPREISLDCYLKAATVDAFLLAYNALITELVKPGTQRLQLMPGSKALAYEVYLKDGIDPEKQWRDVNMHGKFTLNLIEPQPVKWIFWSMDAVTVSLTGSSSSPITVSWGDGQTDKLEGTNQTLTHSYTGSGFHYLLLAGELEQLTLTNHQNLNELWPRLY